MIWIWAATTAHATWSIVAADANTGQVGGAGTSCVGKLDMRILFAPAPGVGAVHAQAWVNVDGRDEAASLLAKGSTPQQALDAITDPGFDGAASFRQYGIVNVSGNAVAWTGDNNGDWAGDVQGFDGTYTYSAQGNILTGAEVVQRTADVFADPGLCDLADKLMIGLEAGGAPKEGDSRCTPDLSSDSAFIRVVDVYGDTMLDLSVTDTAPNDALVALRAQFDVWRTKNPCYKWYPIDSDVSGDTGSGDADSSDTATSDTAAQPDPTQPPAATATGCGCATPTGPNAVVILLALVGFRSTRRRR